MVDLYLFILAKDFIAVKDKVGITTEHLQINYHYEWSQHKSKYFNQEKFTYT